MKMWSVALVVLAQVPPPKAEDVSRATVLLVVLTAVVILAFVVAAIVIYVVRSRTLRTDATAGDVPLTLHDLRGMRERGEIDDDEMARLRTIVLAQAKKDRVRPPDEDAPST